MHIAPGCGQEDFALSKADELAVIAPIDEFGIFRDGFGWQTGRYAGAATTRRRDLAREVADDLEREGPARRAASSTATATRSAGAAAPSSSSAWSTSGSSPWTRCAPS